MHRSIVLVAQEIHENPIDAHFSATWKEKSLEPSRATDHEFLRRVTLDVLGRPPRPEEVRAFEKKPDRTKKIDELLASDEAASFWADSWMRTFLDGKFEETAPLKMSFPAFREYLRTSWVEDVPWTRTTRELLASSGDDQKNPGVNFALGALDPKEPPHELAARSARIFLAVPLQCARCHDHPTEKISQDQFWSFTAFFSGLRPKPRTTFEGFSVKLVDDGARSISIPEAGREAAPRFLDGRAPSDPRTAREALARFVVESPRFRRAIVNRIWARFLGRAFVEPVDGWGEDAKVEHPRLLEKLSEDFGKSPSLKKLVRTILTSRVYELSSEARENAAPGDYAFHPSRPQDPIQMLGTLTWALDLDVFLKQFYKGFLDNKALPEVYRNETVFRTYLFLYVQRLLAPDGASPERAGSVRLALKLANGKDLQGLVNAGWGRLKDVLAKSGDADARIDEIFYVLLGRPPSAAEKARYRAYVLEKKSSNAAWEDVYWALLNSEEMYFNH